MKIIIIGAGEVGHNLCTTLAATGHNVTLIEQSELRCEKLDEEQNARIINGKATRLGNWSMWTWPRVTPSLL